jgi:predicted PurR-regulated permease PerM
LPAIRQSPAASQRDALTPGGLFRVGVLLLAVIAAALAISRLQEIVVIFVIAIVLAEGLRPVVAALEGRGLHWELARAIVYLTLVASIVIVAVLLTRPLVVQTRAVLADLPGYQQELQRNLAPVLDALSLDPNLSSQLSGYAGTVVRGAVSLAAGVVRGLLDAVVVLLLSFLWLSSGRRFGGFLLGLLHEPSRPTVTAAWTEIAAGFAGYVRGVGVNMVVIGLLSGVAAALLGLPAPVLLGVLAGVTEMIPIVGPIIGAVPAILLGFTISPVYPLIVALVYLGIQQIEAHTLVPLVMRRSVGLPPLAVVLALATGGALAGIGGALLAVPVAFAAQVVLLRLIAPAIREPRPL